MSRLLRRIPVLILAWLVLLLAFAEGDKAFSMDQGVPFGTTRSQNGQYVPVFDKVGSNNKTDLLTSGQICAVDAVELRSSYYWYHIHYLDENGNAHSGYVKESNFEQMTVSDLTEMMMDQESAGIISQLKEYAGTSLLSLAGTDTETGQKGQHYVLNTNTKKFHYPGCKSVKQMKEKNRKDYTGSRDEIIKMGFVPCKNCNP